MEHPLRALAISGEILIVCDALTGKIHRFHKVSSQSGGLLPGQAPQHHRPCTYRSCLGWSRAHESHCLRC
jgi:hypothetical protein